MKLHEYINDFSKTSMRVKYLHIFLILPTLIRRGLPAFRSFVWFVRANKELEDADARIENLDAIEVLWVVSAKDLPVLLHSIEHAQLNTLNPIKSMHLIVPDKDYEKFRLELAKMNIEINIRKDSELIESKKIHEIMTRFGAKGGWLLQQFLKLEFVLKSNERGVLIIDGDTIITKKTIWLQTDGTQVLLKANSRFRPYFDTLAEIGLKIVKPKYSFVTHHMLLQPKFLNECFQFLGLENIYDLNNLISISKNERNIGTTSIDFELYGNYLLKFHKEKVRLHRFNNLSLPISRMDTIQSVQDKNHTCTSEYKSISFHSWNNS